MANYTSLYATIAANIYTNHDGQVTAEMVKAACNSIVASLGFGYQFRGAAAPGDAGPGSIDQRVFYIASTPGTYSGFGSLTLAANEVALLKWDTEWHKETLDIPSKTQIMSRLAAQDGNISALDSEVATFEAAVRYMVENYPNITINGDVVNAPDEEDITTDENNLLKFANRPALNGMGYIILRKNKTFAEQVTQQNTIYEIRYDFDLDGASVTIPAGCVLKFNGGCISNGTLQGNATGINAEITKIFKSITINGTWFCPVIYSDWFDFVKNTEEDNSRNFKNLSNIQSNTIHNDIHISSGIYWTQPDNGFPYTEVGRSRPIVMKIKGNTNVYNAGTIKLLKSNNPGYTVLLIQSSDEENNDNVEIIGGKIVGDLLFHTPASALGKEWGMGVYIQGASNVTIKDLEVSYCLGDGICTREYYYGNYSDYDPSKTVLSNNVNIINCQCSYNHRQGLSICGGCHNYFVRNSVFEKTGKYIFTAPGAGIDVEPDHEEVPTDNIIISGCSFIDNQKGVEVFKACKNVIVENCTDIHTSEYVPHVTPDYEGDIYGQTPASLFLDTRVFDHTSVTLKNYIADGFVWMRCGFANIVNSEFTNIRFAKTPLSGDGVKIKLIADNSLFKSISDNRLISSGNLQYFEEVSFNRCSLRTAIRDGLINTDFNWPITIKFNGCNIEGNGEYNTIPCFAEFVKCYFSNSKICYIDGSNINSKCTIFDSIIYLSALQSAATRVVISKPEETTTIETVYVQGLQIFQDDNLPRQFTLGCNNTNSVKGKFSLFDVYIDKMSLDDNLLGAFLERISTLYPSIDLWLRNNDRFTGPRVTTSQRESVKYLLNRYRDNGIHVFDTDLSDFCIWKDDKFVSYDGATSGTRRYGTTAQRPAFANIYNGFKYFDTTIGMEVIAHNGTWVDSNGRTPGKHFGELADLPNFASGTAGANDDGYMFMFTDDATYGNKTVWWNTNAGGWVDATGSIVIPIL